eukprot:scaffold29533_cov102-Skeletonema_marinoi.AAC.1
MASSCHLRRCSDGDTTNQCLSRGKDASILSRPTIMGHYKRRQLRSLRRSRWPHQVTYDVVATREIRYGRQLRSLRRSRWLHQVTYDVVATPIRPTNA